MAVPQNYIGAAILALLLTRRRYLDLLVLAGLAALKPPARHPCRSY